MRGLVAEKEIKNYFKRLKKESRAQVKLAKKARKKGFDIHTGIETLPVADLADRTETIIGPKGIAKRYRELYSKTHGQNRRIRVIFKLFKEIIEEKWCSIPNESKRIEQAIKTSLVLYTEGVVVAPLDGVPKVTISKNPDGSKYIDIFYAGPIRAAGGTSQVLPLILGDYARKLLNLDKYKPTKDEIERYVEENQIYEEIVSRQYKLGGGEVRKIVKGCPVCINGEPTEKREVSVHRDIKRIPHNRVRGGMCLVLSEGIGLKARKILKFSKMLDLDWSWLEQIIKHGKEKKEKIEPKAKYLEGTAAGRPIFSYPSRPGGFRLRYGRTRAMGIMGKAIHPATMEILDEFIAIGTQIKVERPGKAGSLTACDSIEGPIVLLKDGEVKQIQTVKEAKKIKPRLEKILYLGDLLIAYGDFKYSAHKLLPSGYNQEWWALELKKAMEEKKESSEEWEKIVENPHKIDGKTAIKISKKYNIPLHPSFTDYYSELEPTEAKYLIKTSRQGKQVKENGKIKRVELDLNKKTKGLLEKIGAEHSIQGKKIVIGEKKALAFLTVFGAFTGKKIKKRESIQKMLEKASGLKLREKGKTFIGARMGRPEASSPRKMKGNPHVLFPVGNYGGNTRSINKAMEISEQKNGIEIQISAYRCPKCKKILVSPYCPECKERTEKINMCQKCGTAVRGKRCPKCGSETRAFNKRKEKIEQIISREAKRIGIRAPKLVKGVRGMINENKAAEPIGKGLLRARHDLHIFRDGTIRYELINNPLTHFKPSEINTSVKKLKELGYQKDINGKELENKNQILELKPQDLIIHKKAGDFFVKVSKFLDEELKKFYGLPKKFKARNRKDLIGELVLGLAPHTSAAIIGRIIGYTKARGCFAHPYFHQTKRRNCLTGNTPVVLEDNSGLKNIPIKKLDNGEKKETIPLKGLYTLTVDKHGELKRERVKALFKKKGAKKLLEIKTVFGRTLTVTPKQKILFEKNGKASVKHASKLKKGDRLLSLAKIEPKKESGEINVLEWYLKNSSKEQKKKIRVHNVKQKIKEKIEELGGCWKIAGEINYRNWLSSKKQGKTIYNAIWFDSIPLDLFEKIIGLTGQTIEEFKNATISYNKQKSKIPAIIKLNRELGEVIGFYLADGYARTTDNKKRKKYVYQVNLISAEMEIKNKMEKNIREIFKRKVTENWRGGIVTLTLSGRIYYDFFTKILKTGEHAKNKRVPFQILNASNKCVEGCLAGYIAGDGSIGKNCIKTTSVNQELTNDFALLSARLGMFAHLSQPKKRTINSGPIKEFYKKKNKKITIKSHILRLYSEDFKRISRALFGRKKKQAKKVLETHNFTKKRARKMGNFVLDKIKSIKTTKNKEKYVYDLIVEGEKTFIGGMGNLAIFDCDGDQDSVMLLLDGLLNFSQDYLPSSRGGRMDAPLVFTEALRPDEIDTEVHEMDTCKKYPLDLYIKAEGFFPAEIEGIETVGARLGSKKQYSGFGFTHQTSAFDQGPATSRYVQLHSMEEKIFAQAKLQSKIRAVDLKDSLERVVVSHFMPDIIGNVRAFSRQKFRCTNCNAKYRRIPLNGECKKCEDGNLVLTIAPGSVVKYLDIVKRIVNSYSLSDYLKQRIELMEEEINSVLKDESMTQKSLAEFA